MHNPLFNVGYQKHGGGRPKAIRREPRRSAWADQQLNNPPKPVSALWQAQRPGDRSSSSTRSWRILLSRGRASCKQISGRWWRRRRQLSLRACAPSGRAALPTEHHPRVGHPGRNPGGCSSRSPWHAARALEAPTSGVETQGQQGVGVVQTQGQQSGSGGGIAGPGPQSPSPLRHPLVEYLGCNRHSLAGDLCRLPVA